MAPLELVVDRDKDNTAITVSEEKQEVDLDLTNPIDT